MTDLPNFDMENAEVEVVEHPPASTERSAARRVVLQVLYEIDCCNHMVGDVISARLSDEVPSRRVARYVRQIASGVAANLEPLDTFLQRFALEFPLDQLSIIDRNILRLGVYELADQQNTSMNVIIAEALELATIYGSEGSVRFVNGVLGAIAAEVTTDNSPQLIVTENGD